MMNSNNDGAWKPYWEKYRGLFWYAVRIVSRYFHLPPEEATGPVFLALVRCATHYKKEHGAFSTYFIRAAFHAVADMLHTMSEAGSRRELQNKSQRKQAILDMDTYESDYFMYRIPNKDDELIEALFALYDYDSLKLWNAITQDLKPKWRELLYLRFFKKKLDKEIAEEWGVSKQRINQQYWTILHTLRERMQKLEAVAKLFGLYDVSLPKKGVRDDRRHYLQSEVQQHHATEDGEWPHDAGNPRQGDSVYPTGDGTLQRRTPDCVLGPVQ